MGRSVIGGLATSSGRLDSCHSSSTEEKNPCKVASLSNTATRSAPEVLSSPRLPGIHFESEDA